MLPEITAFSTPARTCCNTVSGSCLAVARRSLRFLVFISLALWLIMWPVLGFFDVERVIQQGTKGHEHVGEQFWAYWGQALVFLAIYGGIGWPLRAIFVERAEPPHDGRRRDKPSGQTLTLSWQTFWFVVVAVAAGNLAASAIRQIFLRILDLLEAALVTVVIPTSRAAVALALITTALERWANWWVKQRQSEVRP